MYTRLCEVLEAPINKNLLTPLAQNMLVIIMLAVSSCIITFANSFQISVLHPVGSAIELITKNKTSVGVKIER